MSQIIDSRLTSEAEYRNIFESAGDGLIIYDIQTELVVEANPIACEMHGYTHQEFVGLNPKAFMLPESHVLFREHLQMAEPGGVVELLVIHLHKNGTSFHTEAHRSAVNYRGRPCLLSVIRDVSQRIQIEENLSGLIEARRREQATLLAISHILASTLELQPGLILDQLREIIKYKHGGIFVLEGSSLVAMALRGTGRLEQSAPIRINLDAPETLSALFNGYRPIRIADVRSNDLRFSV